MSCRQMKPMDRITDAAIVERFMAKVSKNADTGCWDWGSTVVGQYGAFTISNKLKKAHRVSYCIHIGDIGCGLIVCHRCDNPLCVNPEHLFIGTHKDNSRDMSSKGRVSSRHGELHPMGRLTIDDVDRIRSSDMNSADAAEMFGVHRTHINRIRSGSRWGNAS
jgi:hypothetical protein